MSTPEALPCPACGSDSNERDELTKAEREIERLTAAPAPHPDTADAERWRHVWQCVRMAQHGEYVLMPDEPTGLPGDSLVRVMFLREVDAAIDAARAIAGERDDGKAGECGPDAVLWEPKV